MNDQDRSEGKKFKIYDRRLFTEEGELREESPQPRKPRETARPLDASNKPEPEDRDRNPIEFSSFLLSLAGSAMMHLGEGGPQGAGTHPPENLEAACQMIDILVMLKKKTQGNRSAEEDKLLEQLLFELQMTYVRKSKG